MEMDQDKKTQEPHILCNNGMTSLEKDDLTQGEQDNQKTELLLKLKKTTQHNRPLVIYGDDVDTDDVWDDRILQKSYNKAVKMVDAAIKKNKLKMKGDAEDRSARNETTLENKEKSTPQSLPSSSSSSSVQVKEDQVKDRGGKKTDKYQHYTHKSLVTTYRFNASPGKYCRCPYSEDGRDYEAVICDVYPTSDSVLVRYIGYENEEVRPISLLKNSAGEQARQKQTEMALIDKSQEETVCDDEEDTEDPSSSPERVDVEASSSSQKNSSPVKRTSSERQEPNVPPQVFPPCPPPLISSGNSEEDEALASMLMSWYMSGYHTGYFQAMKKYRK